MKTQRISGIIFLVFLIISLMPAGAIDASIVSPFFLNEIALVVWSIAAFIQLKQPLVFLVTAVFLVGAAQNVYLLEYLMLTPGLNTLTVLWASFVIMLIVMLLVGTVMGLLDFKNLSNRDKFTWLLFLAALTSAFVLTTEEDPKYLLIAFVVQMALLISLLLNMRFKPYVLIWEAWLLYSSLEVLKTLSLLEAA